jgi:hypothetical protein
LGAEARLTFQDRLALDGQKLEAGGFDMDPALSYEKRINSNSFWQ